MRTELRGKERNEEGKRPSRKKTTTTKREGSDGQTILWCLNEPSCEEEQSVEWMDNWKGKSVDCAEEEEENSHDDSTQLRRKVSQKGNAKTKTKRRKQSERRKRRGTHLWFLLFLWHYPLISSSSSWSHRLIWPLWNRKSLRQKAEGESWPWWNSRRETDPRKNEDKERKERRKDETGSGKIAKREQQDLWWK